MAKARVFQAVLGGGEGDRPTVEIPFDVSAEYGSARPKVKATVNGVELRTTVAVYGGRSYVGFRKEIQKQAGITVGDRIRVKLEPDLEVREVEVPEDLARALARDKPAKAIFDGLAFTHRREYAQWIAGGKKAETRQRRVEKAFTMLKDGTRHP